MKKLVLTVMTGIAMLSAGAADLTGGPQGPAVSTDNPGGQSKEKNGGVQPPPPPAPQQTEKPAAPGNNRTGEDDDVSEPQPVRSAKPETQGAKPAPKKRASLGVISIILGALSLVLMSVAVVFSLLMHKKLLSVAQSVKKCSDANARLEKAFEIGLEDAIKDAIAEADRNKNPILQEYDDLKQRNIGLEDDLDKRNAELKNSQDTCAQLRQEVAGLQNDLGKAQTQFAELQRQFDARGGELDATKKSEAEFKKNYEDMIALVGKTVLESWPDEIDENDPRIRFVIMGLSKMNALRDAKVDARAILREFQSFDKQLHAAVADQADLQNIRESIKPFVCKLLDNQYQISWPKVGSNIADYNRDDLDLDGSPSGTTIKTVKCATINFVNAEGAPFQRAGIICG